MMAEKTGIHEDDLPAGRLCLEFANTANWHASEAPEETLLSYADLLEWAKETGVVTGDQFQALGRAARQQPQAAEVALSEAIRTREVIYRIFAAVADQQSPQEADLEALKMAFSRALPHTEFVPTSEGFSQVWSTEEVHLQQILWPVVHSAVALLTSSDLDRVGQCADDRGCGWLFFDQSRNHSRRWCSMEGCGNRAKAARHYRRQKSQ